MSADKYLGLDMWSASALHALDGIYDDTATSLHNFTVQFGEHEGQDIRDALDRCACGDRHPRERDSRRGSRRRRGAPTPRARCRVMAMEPRDPPPYLRPVHFDEDGNVVEPEDRSPIVFADRMACPLPPIPWICKALCVAPGRPTTFVGLAGTRKSFLLLGLGLAVASATQTCVLGFDVRRGRALHIDLEATRRPTFERIQALARGNDIDLASLGKSLGYAWRPISWRRNSLDALCRLVDGFDLVGVDAVRGALDGNDENGIGASEPHDLAIAASEKTGASFVFIDHGPGKPRGHSSKVDASGVIIAFATAQMNGPTFVQCTRDQVSGREGGRFAFTHVVDENAIRLVHVQHPLEGSKPVREPPASQTGLAEPPERALQAVREALRVHRNLKSANDVAAKAHGGGKQPVLAALRALRASGEVVVVDGFIRLSMEVSQ